MLFKDTSMSKGLFITFEGCDGSGKTTQASKLASYLRSKGYLVTQLREPGGTGVGEYLRTILLNAALTPMTELLLFLAARQAMYDEIIKPALEAGRIVICDRYIDSTYAYQGEAKGLKDEVLVLERIIADGKMPDYTFYLNIDLSEAMRRLEARMDYNDNKFDIASEDFKIKVHKGFIERSRKYKHRILTIDGTGSVDEVAQRIQSHLNNLLT